MKLICVLCGKKGYIRDKDTAIALGWHGYRMKNGKEKSFCPDHNELEITQEIIKEVRRTD